MTNYKLQESGIFYVEFIGTFGLAEAKQYMSEFQQLKHLSSPLNILYNLKETDLQFSIEDLPKLALLAEASTAGYTPVKAAYLIDNPKLTAFGMVFSSLKESPRTTRRIFSTLEAAEKWLLST